MFFLLAIVCALWGIVSSIVITSFLLNRGVKVNFLLLRIMILKYISQYRSITIQETGKPGFWFYSYIIAMSCALVSAVIGIVLKVI